MTFGVGDRVRLTREVGPFKKGDEAVLIYQDTEFSSYPYRAETVNGDCPVSESEIEAVEPTPASGHTSPYETCKACNPIPTNQEGTPPVAETSEKRRQVVHNDYESGKDSIFEVVAEDGDELWVRYVYDRHGIGGGGNRRYSVPAAEYKTYVPEPAKGEKWSGGVTVHGVVDGVVVYSYYGSKESYYAREVANFTGLFEKVDDNG